MPEVTKSFTIILSSDGSGSPLQSGGGAAILEVPEAELRFKLAGYLGPCNGNEAEIMAGFLGIAAAEALFGRANSEWRFGRAILWQTDSEYLIRTVKQLKNGRARNSSLSNFRFWTAISLAWSDFSIEPQHVRARGGNRRNHACDQASRWIQRQGKRLLAQHGEQAIGRLKTSVPREAWQLFDLTKLVEMFRIADDEAIRRAVPALQERVRERLGQFL